MTEGPPVAGLTILGEQICLLRRKEGNEIEVYDVVSHRFRRYLTTRGIGVFTDMTSCAHFLWLYISDADAACVHRLNLQGNASKWPVSAKPCGLSVNAAHNVLVACRSDRKIKEFSPNGDLIRDVTLPADLVKPWHAIELTIGQLVVCHGGDRDPVSRVCIISAEDSQTVCAHGRQPGADIDQYMFPAHLAVDSDGSVFVSDVRNRRVTLLSPRLHYIRQVVSRDQLQSGPGRLCFDSQRRRLYVADNIREGGQYTEGRVVVVTV